MKIFLQNKLLWLPVLLVVVLFQIGMPSNPPASEPPQQPSMIGTSSLPLCSNEQLTRGRWLPITLERPPYIPLSPRVRCLKTQEFYQPFQTHQWTPSENCRLAKWNAPRFARLLSNQTIVFVGDSLTLEHYASLVHLLADRARLPPKAVQHKRIKRHICHNTTAASHCVEVVFKTDFDLLSISQEVEKSQPTVLVLNRGAHYVPDEELLTSLKTHTVPALQQWSRTCGNCLLIWRTTVPGHPHCEKFTQPATSVAELQAYIEQASTKDAEGPYRKGEYHWQDFQRQNQLVVQLLQRELGPVLQIMDSYQTNILRPDNHRSHMNDCLHSCSPGGGSDLNSQWLLHMLLKQREEKARPS